MSAAIAEVMGSRRNYFLFDSFEGLPEPTVNDGPAAFEYQRDKEAPNYLDNCRAPIELARTSMEMSGAENYSLVKGWFKDTLIGYELPEPIAILRLDGDWYDSTYLILEAFFNKMAPGGIIIVDDYLAWDGCRRAVHDFLSRTKSTARIREELGVFVIER